MAALTANTPEELYQAIGKFLQSDYSREKLVTMYEDARKCANGFRVTYPALPTVPARNDDPLDGLQDVTDWCIKSSEVIDDIGSNLERQTIIAVISQLKKLRDFPRRVLSLVNSKLREQAQKEARAKVEKEYKNLNDKVSRLKLEKMLLIDQAKIIGELQLEEQEILRRETKEIVHIYLSKDPTFKDRLSQLNSEINEMLETLNKLVGSNTPTGKLLDIYCKLKDIPLQQQFDDVGYAYCPIDDLTDVICSGCNRLYTSVDNVIKTFEEIQMKAGQQIDETPPQTDLAKNGALERIKKEVDKTDQERLQEIIEVLKNWQKSKKPDKDFEAAKSALPPIAKTYDILCRSIGQCGAKTTDIIRSLGEAANNGSGYYPALLNELASPEVIADLEKWQEKPVEKADKQEKATTTSQPDSIVGDIWTIFGIPINIKKLCTKLKRRPFLLTCCLSLIVIIATYSLWYPLINKTDHSPTASTNIFADVSKDGSILRSNNFPWEIRKSNDQDGNILYTIVDRRGDATAVSVVPDNPKYTVYQSYGGMVIKYTCPEEKISNFTIKLKY